MTSESQAPEPQTGPAEQGSYRFPAGNYLAHAQHSRDASFWQQWAVRALLVLGAVHVLAGIVFFFAYNWEALPPFAKFGIIQAGLVLSFLAALYFRLDRTGGQALLIVSSVFTGVLFAVIGQVYQTGADAWQLFVAWIVLTAPWVIASRSAAHWLFWIVLFMTSVSLYGGQVLVALDKIDPIMLSTGVALLPLLFLAARELALHRGVAWLDGDWFRRALLVLGMVPLFAVALGYVFGVESEKALVGFVTFIAAVAVIAHVYMKLLPDFVVLAIVVAMSSLLAMSIGGRVIFEMFTFRNPGAFTLALLILGAWCVFVTTAVVRLLNFMRRQLPEEARHDG